MRGFIGAFVVAVVASGCGADLPGGWEGADRISVKQSVCQESAYDGGQETIEATSGTGSIALVYGKAHFRCEQKVEAFLKTEGSVLHVLVQPVEMDPDAVAACDCLYDISASLKAESSVREVAVWRRWDNLNAPNEPVLVGAKAAMALPAD